MDRSKIAPRLKQSEGCTNFMYLCTGGKVTVGVGHAIETPAAAVKLKWTVKGEPATPAQVKGDYAKVAAAERNHIASAYAGLTGCRMTEDAVAELLDSDIGVIETQLAKAIPNWTSLPECVQEAIFDMGFNLGVPGLTRKFPKLVQAISRGDWATAAAECRRNGIGDQRNQETAELFRQASSGAADAVNA